MIVAALGLSGLASLRLRALPAGPLERAPLPHAAAVVRALREGEVFELNRATPGDLQLLPGVGPKLAERIVAERTRRGGFHQIEELLDVKGVGPATFAQVRRFVTVNAPATDRAARSR